MKKGTKIKIIACMLALTCTASLGSMTTAFAAASNPSVVLGATPASAAKTILNSAKLNPQKTGYKVIDDKIDALLAQFRKEGATDTYSQVKACYDWLIKNVSYGWTSSPKMEKPFGFSSYAPYYAIYEAYGPLFKGYGVCNDYTSAFILMTRAIGLESYYYSGETSKQGGGYTGHAWCEININGTNYIFDAQVEDNIADILGSTQYMYFCKTEKEMSSRYIWQSPEKIEERKRDFNAKTRLSKEEYVVSNISELKTLLSSKKNAVIGKDIYFSNTVNEEEALKTIKEAFPEYSCHTYPVTKTITDLDDYVRIDFPESSYLPKLDIEKGKPTTFEISNIPSNVTVETKISDPTIATLEEIPSSSKTKKIYKVNTLQGGFTEITVSASDGYTRTEHLLIESHELPVDKDSIWVTEKVGKDYFTLKGITDPSAVKLVVHDPSIAQVTLADAKNPEGLKYQVTGSELYGHGGEGTWAFLYYGDKCTSITVGSMAIDGSIMLDTANYKMAPGNIYDIGVTIKDDDENKKLSGKEIQELIQEGILKVSDSRNGSIVKLTPLPNGNFRITGRKEGSCYIMFEIVDQNKTVTHASIKIDVKKGSKQGGTATRNTSYWTEGILWGRSIQN